MHELPQGFETYIKLLQTLIISYFPDRRTEMENAGYATKLRQIAFKGFPRKNTVTAHLTNGIQIKNVVASK